MGYREVIINNKPVKLIPLGDCACGCGQKTNIPKWTVKSKGWVKGRPHKFVKNHQHRGAPHHNWNGGRTETDRGYIRILLPDHPRANTRGYVLEHILIAEKALGKLLPAKAVIHHHTSEQLVVCQDQAYHNLLHQRQRAFESCGHADWRKCSYCKQYDDPGEMCFRSGNSAVHRVCRNAYENNRRKRIRA